SLSLSLSEHTTEEGGEVSLTVSPELSVSFFCRLHPSKVINDLDPLFCGTGSGRPGQWNPLAQAGGRRGLPTSVSGAFFIFLLQSAPFEVINDLNPLLSGTGSGHPGHGNPLSETEEGRNRASKRIKEEAYPVYSTSSRPCPRPGGALPASGQMAQDASIIDSPRRRSGLLRDQVQLVKRKDCDRYEMVPIQEPLSFEKGFFIVIRACQLLAQKNDGIIFVGVAGPSGAGKTVFTEKVLNFMPSVAVISMDNYNDASRIIDGNFDDPRLTDYDTLLENIHGLKDGKDVQVPIYDFKTSSRIGYRTIEAPSSRIVIIEGIYALSEKLRPLLDLRVSVTGGVHFDLVKRVLRDIQRAGQEPEEIIHQISETVYPMYKAFIEPDLQTAHIKIINKFNPFSGFQNPTYILKLLQSTRTLTVDKIRSVFSDQHIESTEETYDIYLLPPGEDPETCQSYLRMRNRDGKYNLMFEVIIYLVKRNMLQLQDYGCVLHDGVAMDSLEREGSLQDWLNTVSRTQWFKWDQDFFSECQEWVTDSPFIISPRITFEVSVRLLGGLMALGYTIATILKRSSHVFADDKVVVKIDWLEQLNRHYVQVQGRDRLIVRQVAEQLGLEGSYVPRTYIEQIQLEKLVNDVMTLPDDLKTKLSIDDDMVSSPKEALSRASAERIAMRNRHFKT
ncbi:hypothetical protein Taro_002216, partial [Colocasia esculenta]|nr:hypothetical protein [Colocasia esculenta]